MQLSPIEFEQLFILNFHNIKISKFTPDFIKDRNLKIEIAFNHIKEAIHRIQAWQNNEKVRVRIESDHLKSLKNYSYISQITTPFIVVILCCDTLGRYQITFGLDSNYLKILPEFECRSLVFVIHLQQSYLQCKKSQCWYKQHQFHQINIVLKLVHPVGLKQ
jgi:hypothetical protein